MHVNDPDRPSAFRTFYRIVKSGSPTRDDFLSLAAQGRVPSEDLTDDQRRQWEGISVFATRQQALQQADRFPRLGRFIVELHIGENGPIHFQRTNPSRPGHHTLWGPPEELLRSVAEVEQIPITRKV